ncbi:MAG: YgiQ family radical SAM protein [Bacteroidales bacterium]|jgi:uncharacterized radical SAM protein YgiQ
MQSTDRQLWLPTTLKEVKERGWDELDVILFSGDAYIDHPSFGTAVIGRVLESMGLKVAIVPQPNWRDDLRDFKKLGRPRLFFGISAGVMDSMVNHYTAGKRLRSNDAYTPGNKAGFRPDYPTIVYSKILKKIFPDMPIIAGGVEASLRRVTHYDYWKDKLMPSMIAMSDVDLIVYGMGEKPLMQVVDLMLRGVPFNKINTVPQTVFKVSSPDQIPVNKKWDTFELNAHETCLEDKVAYAKNFRVIEVESNRINAQRLIQKTGGDYVVINPAIPWLEEKEIDFAYDLPYTRLPHFKYNAKDPIPAYEMIKYSVNMHRGCFGGCAFCTISAHQGKFISSRSERSILEEVKKVAQMPDFKGHISDLGGPSANMYQMKGRDLGQCALCKRPSCIYPAVCTNLEADHGPMLDIYKKVDEVPGVKKVTIGSGIRYDLLMPERNKNGGKSMDQYIKAIAEKHVSGRLKIAPEHTAPNVLSLMRKPPFGLYDGFQKKFMKASQDAGLKQQIVPYFISSHPGCEETDMAQLAVDTKDAGLQLEQVQDFTPTPMTTATVMYYSGLNPDNLKPVYTAKSKDEKKAQNMFFFWYKPEFKQFIQSRLMKLNRPDLASRLLDKKR